MEHGGQQRGKSFPQPGFENAQNEFMRLVDDALNSINPSDKAITDAFAVGTAIYWQDGCSAADRAITLKYLELLARRSQEVNQTHAASIAA